MGAVSAPRSGVSENSVLCQASRSVLSRAVLAVIFCVAWIAAPAAETSSFKAVVNEVALEEWELDRELAMLISAGSYHRNVSDSRRKELRCQSMKGLVLKELKRQWADVNPVEVDPAVAEASWQEVRERFTSDKEYRAALEFKGISDTGFRQALQRDAAAGAVDASVISSVAEPTETEVEVYFILHHDDYMTPETRHVVHALVYVKPSASKDEWKRAEERASELADRVSGGEISLLEAAQPLTEALPPTLRDQVGDIGFVHRGSLQPAVDEAVFKVEPGSVTAPVVTIYGYHVLQVINTRPPKPIELADVRAAVASRIVAEKRQDDLTTFEEELLEAAVIEVSECAERF